MNYFKEKIKKRAALAAARLSDTAQQKVTGITASANLNDGDKKILRQTAADGCVLLKNDGTLPFKEKSAVALFGRVQCDWFYTGYGSGGDVNALYKVNLVQGIRNCAKLRLYERLAVKYESWCEQNPVFDGIWGMWPRSLPEMPLDEYTVNDAALNCDYAVVVIGRSSGEDRENVYEKGSWFLTDDEIELLKTVTGHFKKVVVLLNIGALIDFEQLLSFGDKISAIIIVWQGGMESGNAASDLLCGNVNPSGKLPDTIAPFKSYPSSNDFGGRDFNNYSEDIYVGYRYFETFAKDEVIFPFGYGLSYTAFELDFESPRSVEGGFEVECKVKNSGNRAGREVVQIYLEKPQGVLGNPLRELAAFKKTAIIQPGKSEKVKMFVPDYFLASYDETGKTGFESAYVIEEGKYNFYGGHDAENAENIFTYYQNKTELYLQQSQNCAPKEQFDIIFPVKGITGYLPVRRPVNLSKTDLKRKIINNLPREIPPLKTEYKFSDIKRGRISLDDFVSTLNKKELETLSRGDFIMNSPLGFKGNAGAFGGTSKSLIKKGVPALITTDGPSGIRLAAKCALVPIGTLFASSFDPKAVEATYQIIARQMTELGSDVLLAPGMNIHRNPLCGRNFEYYSEDPLLTGKIGAAAIRGIQSTGKSACPKHLACNNQEFNRTHNDSRVSERALRQIYLRGFEMAVKEAHPKNIMTSYNKVNGVWSHYNYELVNSILRGEWGYKGNVITDWWMRSAVSPEFPRLRNQSYRARSGVDVLMPGGKRGSNVRKANISLTESLGKKGGITLAELQQIARHVLRCVLEIKK